MVVSQLYERLIGLMVRGRCEVSETVEQTAAPLPAGRVADWFLLQVKDDPEQDLSNLKLQKLVYLASSCFAYEHGRSLVAEDIQAWEHGPVVKPLYGRFAGFGNAPIQIDSYARLDTFDQQIVESLEKIWMNFAGYSPSKLRNITHAVGPWPKRFRSNIRNIVLPKDEIAQAWPDFCIYAETPLVARTNDYTSALARYKAIRSMRAMEEEQPEPALALQDFEATKGWRALTSRALR